MLVGHEPSRILSSPALRCLETVEPLSDELGLPVVPDARLAEGVRRSGAVDLLEELGTAPDAEAATVALCTHGDVIPALVHELVARGMEPDRDLVWQKGSVWVVEGTPHRPAAGHYLEPPQPF